jgi:hypothetical protein
MMISGADSGIKNILAFSNMLFKLNTNGHVCQHMDPSPTGWQQIGNSQGTLQIVCENRNLHAFTQFGAVM